MKKVKIRAIEEIKKRAGDSSERSPFASTVYQIQSRQHGRATTDDFIPIKLVTILEVFARHWVGRLVDHGNPYLERVDHLMKGADFKLDLQSFRAIHGRSITFGDLIAHSVSVNSFDDFERHFDTLLDTKTEGTSFQKLLLERSNGLRIASEFYDDPVRMFACIGRLFWVRHILCHELPAERPYGFNDLTEFIGATLHVIEVAEEIFQDRLYGKDRYRTAEEVLTESQEKAARLMKYVGIAFTRAKDRTSNDQAQLKLLEQDQQAWESYLQTQCRFYEHIAYSDGPLMVAIIQKQRCEERIRFLGGTGEEERDEHDVVEESPA